MAVTARTTHRRHKIVVVACIVVALLAGAAWYGRIQSRIQGGAMPAINTGGLEPAVATLVERSVAEVRASPETASAWGKLGIVLMHYEFVREGTTALRQAARLEPGSPRWPYLLGLFLAPLEPVEALSQFRVAARLSGGSSDAPHLKLAEQLIERAEWDEATPMLEAILKQIPAHPMASLGLARVLIAHGKWNEAAALLDRCLQNPHTAQAAHRLMAQVQHALGNAEVAREFAEKGRALQPDRAWPDPFWEEAAAYRVGRKVRLQDAQRLLDDGQISRAIEQLRGITQDYPGDDEGWYLAGWSFNRSQLPAEAERALRRHLQLNPGSAKGLSQLAVALLTMRRYGEAEEVLKSALQLKPTWRELHSNLGYACLQLGRDDEALRHLQEALRLDPNHLPVYLGIVEVLARSRRTNEIREIIGQARTLWPDDPQVERIWRGYTLEAR